MSPDDPRHGSHAGYLVHIRSGEKACQPCMVAQRRAVKITKMRLVRGVRNRIPLGPIAWAVLDDLGCTTVAAQTGLHRNNLYRLQRRGPDAQVLRATRDLILGCSGHTPVGIQRRLRALSRLGWTMVDVAAIGGSYPTNLRDLQRRATPPLIVKRPVALGIIRAYDELHMRKPPPNRYRTRVVSAAIERGWASPLAWSDIDTDARPHGMRSDCTAYDSRLMVDPVTVLRILSGDVVPANTAERDEAMRRWRADGKPERALCDIQGWKTARYGREDKSA